MAPIYRQAMPSSSSWPSLDASVSDSSVKLIQSYRENSSECTGHLRLCGCYILFPVEFYQSGSTCRRGILFVLSEYSWFHYVTVFCCLLPGKMAVQWTAQGISRIRKWPWMRLVVKQARLLIHTAPSIPERLRSFFSRPKLFDIMDTLLKNTKLP